MKKYLFVLATAFVAFVSTCSLTSCGDDGSGASNTFTVDGKAYSVDIAGYDDDDPIKDGGLVNETSNYSLEFTKLTSSTMGVALKHYNSTPYRYEISSTKGTFTVSGSNMSVSIPTCTLTATDGSGKTVTVSASYNGPATDD